MSRPKRQAHPGPGRRPGAKTDKVSPKQAEERRAAIERRIAAEVARFDFTRRCVELRRLRWTYAEIAMTMSDEMGERITQGRVRQAVLNELRNVEATDDLRFQELDLLESMAAKVRVRIDEYENRPEHLFDVEQYSKIVDTYLKYRDRIAKLLGLDEGGVQGGKSAQDRAKGIAAANAGQHLHVHVGSVEAYEEWHELQEMGLTQLAHDVLELTTGDEIIDAEVVGMHNDAAGTTLAPRANVEPGAERQAGPGSSLEALSLMERLTGDDA